jgi:type IV pilus assembly protein PilB
MEFSKVEISDLALYGPKGCPECNNIGYKGRVGLFELMPVTDEIAKAINASAPEHYLRRIAIREGMVTLRDVGLAKIRQGVTSVMEILKKTAMTKEALPSYLVNPEFERYNNKDVIIRQGVHDSDFFNLVQGSLLVVKNGVILTEIKEPGDFFGLTSAISGKPRSASIISNGRSTIQRFPGDKIPEIIEQYPDVTKNIFEAITNHLHWADEYIEKLIKQPIKKPDSRRIISIQNRRSGVDRRKSNGPWNGKEQRNRVDRRQASVCALE